MWDCDWGLMILLGSGSFSQIAFPPVQRMATSNYLLCFSGFDWLTSQRFVQSVRLEGAGILGYGTLCPFYRAQCTFHCWHKVYTSAVAVATRSLSMRPNSRKEPIVPGPLPDPPTTPFLGQTPFSGCYHSIDSFRSSVSCLESIHPLREAHTYLYLSSALMSPQMTSSGIETFRHHFSCHYHHQIG